jgi:hypothetical protein
MRGYLDLADFSRQPGSPTRGIDGMDAQVTVEEDHTDELIITEHPVEQGAVIHDHAYKRPAELRLQVGWSDIYTDHRVVYETLLDLQAERRPFTVYTGKRTYVNMLVASLRTHTDSKLEYTLLADVTLREVILVNTQTGGVGAGGGITSTSTVNANNLFDPQSNQSLQTTGPIQNVPASVSTETIMGAGGYDPATGNPLQGIPPEPTPPPSGGSEVGAGGGTDPITGNPTHQRVTWRASSRYR